MTAGTNHSFWQSVGADVDGIYRGRSQQTRAPFLDLERVEILRGSQNILFGRNSLAWQPGDRLDIRVKLESSQFDITGRHN